MIAVLMLALGHNFPQNAQFPVPTDAELSAAVQIYREHGLPLPPQRAELVAIPHKFNSGDGGYETEYEFGFKYRDPASGEPRILAGLRVLPDDEFSYRTEVEDSVPIKVEQLSTLKPYYSYLGRMFEAESALALAIQLAYIGETDAAKPLAQRSTPEKRFPYDASVVQRTFVLVADYYASQYVDPKGDDETALKRLRALYASLPASKDESWSSIAELVSRGILEANTPTGASLGSNEYLIDGLADYGSSTFVTHDRYEDPAVLAVLARGKSIVPNLIAHLEDRRATKSYIPRRDNDPTHIVLFKDICRGIVYSLASASPDFGSSINKSKAEEWWDEVKGIDEESFLKSAMYSLSDVGWFGRGKTDFPLRTVPLRMYSFQFPHKLPDLYLESLNWKYNTNEQLAQMISDSGLSPAQKVRLFNAAAERGTAVHQDVATKFLKEYDPDAELEALRTLLRQDDPFGLGGGGDWRAYRLALRVIDRKDKETAELLVTAAKAKGTAIRVNVIDGIYHSGEYGKTGSKSTAIEALSGFLEDTEVHRRGDPRRHAPAELWGFKKPISVRDQAAWCIGRLLDVPVEPRSSWRAEDWANYRNLVIDMLKKRDGGVISSRR